VATTISLLSVWLGVASGADTTRKNTYLAIKQVATAARPCGVAAMSLSKDHPSFIRVAGAPGPEPVRQLSST